MADHAHLNEIVVTDLGPFFLFLLLFKSYATICRMTIHSSVLLHRLNIAKLFNPQ